jgi:hypothetical protein
MTWLHLRPVLRQFSIDGYTLCSLTRASAIVNRQLMATFAGLRRVSQAPTSFWSNLVASRRRSRHGRSRMESSVSAMFSQLPCTGVGWISYRRARRKCLLGGKCFVQRADRMRVPVVLHKPHPSRLDRPDPGSPAHTQSSPPWSVHLFHRPFSSAETSHTLEISGCDLRKLNSRSLEPFK